MELDLNACAWQPMLTEDLKSLRIISPHLKCIGSESDCCNTSLISVRISSDHWRRKQCPLGSVLKCRHHLRGGEVLAYDDIIAQRLLRREAVRLSVRLSVCLWASVLFLDHTSVILLYITRALKVRGERCPRSRS